MFFSNYYIELSPNSNINLISSYKNIRNKFILLYIKKNNLYCMTKTKTKTKTKTNNSSQLYLDAIIYSKYYLYWKIYGCVYSEEIMNILYDIEFIK